MDQTLITVLRYSITYYQKDLFICAQYANKHKATALHKAYWLSCCLWSLSLLHVNIKLFLYKPIYLSFQYNEQLLGILRVKMNAVFSLTLAWSPMVSSSYRQVSDFWNYWPGLASYILAVKWEKKENFYLFFPKIVSLTLYRSVISCTLAACMGVLYSSKLSQK